MVLDESHHIRNRQIKVSKAALALRATHRWALSGTPMVNKTEDLQPIFAFLRAPLVSGFG